MAGPASPQTTRELAVFGVQVASEGWFGFWFDEADPRWPALMAWRARKGWLDEPLSTAEFTKSELRAAPWLEFSTDWQWGYPQPHEDEFGYRKVTYDDSDFCSGCGVGLRQVAPFRLVGEPKWGCRSVLQLNWVFDELFVRPELWEAVFRPLGVPAREVNNAEGAALNSVVQLVVEDRVDLDMEDHASETCDACGVQKYETVSRGFYPAPLTAPTGAVCRSNQWFGTGASAFQGILASGEVYAAIEAARAKGARFLPCEPSLD